MKNVLDGEKRRVVPRWRASGNAVESNARQQAPIRELTEEERRTLRGLLARRSAEWAEEPNAGRALDFMATAMAMGDGVAGREAAEYLVQQDAEAHRPAGELAREYLGLKNALTSPAGVETDRVVTARLRKRLRLYPGDAIGRTDLAFHFAALGEERRAKRELQAAVRLAPTNNFVARAASRYFAHLRDFDRARDLLHRTGGLKSDPWLLAAELSIADMAGRESLLAGAAKTLLASGGFSPRALTELQSAVGSMELAAGASRKARKLFDLSLVDPTENAIAQAEWAGRSLRGLTLSREQMDTEFNFEGRAKNALLEGRWDEAEAEAQSWLSLEPFSARPSQLLTFVAASIKCDFDRAVQIAKEGLEVNPKNATLLNNLAFAEAARGNPHAAFTALNRIDPEGIEPSLEVAILATAGLIGLREGDLEKGRQLYRDAANRARNYGLFRSECVAIANLAKEEFRMGSNRAEAFAKEFASCVEEHQLSADPWMIVTSAQIAAVATAAGVAGKGMNQREAS